MTTTSLGYTIFYVGDVAASVRFFDEAFGFATKFVTPENDYGEVDTGSTTLAFVSLELAAQNLDAAGGFVPPDATRPGAASITVVNANLASIHASALAAGATSYVDPIDKPWGQTVAYVLAPGNVLVELATPIAKE